MGSNPGAPAFASGDSLGTTLRLWYIFQGTAGIFTAALSRARQPQARLFISGRVAQLAEHSALNRQVVGSIPTASTNNQQVGLRSAKLGAKNIGDELLNLFRPPV
jgi:hypothetical protein